MIRFLKRLLQPPTEAARELQTIIHFQCNGCMATDWQEVDRGVIVGRINRKLPGTGSNGCNYIVARRPDGSTFECYTNYCMKGERYMQDRTDNPDEDLTDKWVYLT